MDDDGFQIVESDNGEPPRYAQTQFAYCIINAHGAVIIATKHRAGQMLNIIRGVHKHNNSDYVVRSSNGYCCRRFACAPITERRLINNFQPRQRHLAFSIAGYHSLKLLLRICMETKYPFDRSRT